MPAKVKGKGWHALLLLILSSALSATTVPRITFEQLTDASDLIASGRITKAWGAWDAEHKYIWTHYLLSVRETAKGASASVVEFAEPGGSVGDASMMVAGAVSYQVGSDVAVFLSRMPNGYWRTTGWAQGKYSVDASGRLHGVAAFGAETVELRSAPAGSSLTTLEGLSLGEWKQRVAARTNGRAQ